MARAGPRKITRYGEQFKATAVKLSSLRGVLIQDVAAALDIHPFMLSLWRKQVRDGVIVAKASKLDVETKAELKRLREPNRGSIDTELLRTRPKDCIRKCFLRP